MKKEMKEVILREDVARLKNQLTEQMKEAKGNLDFAKRQVLIWQTRVEQITGSMAACNTLLEKSRKAKRLELESDNAKPKDK